MFLSQFFIITFILGFSAVYSCPANEMESECVNPCNTCEQKGACEPPAACQQGCDCRPGLSRDEKGECVQCAAKSPRCPSNALFLSCCPLTLPTCENPDPEPDEDEECVPGCSCRPGFLKRKDGQCVTPEQCDPREEHGKETCREDEEYYQCTPSCRNTCENIHSADANCQCAPPGCFCREGLLKRADGKCVPLEQCRKLPSPNDPPPKCPKNAIFIQCGSPCPPTCDDLQPAPCEEKCTTACYCKPGYLKRKDGVCVTPMHCQMQKKQERPATKCPENAIYIECGSPCPPTCEDRLPEPCEEKCTKACYCKPGFLVKFPEGKCVKPEHCNTTHVPVDPQPKCPADEQFYECSPRCKNTCENVSNPQVKCPCGPPGCFCKEGLLKRQDGKCVTPEQCKVSPQRECSANQKFYNCTPSCKNTCEHFFNPLIRCRCGPPGCFCKDGLVKRADGKCIPPNQCHAKKPTACPENAEFTDCGPSCRLTCSDPYPAPCTTGLCVRGCFCRPGFVEEKDGRCVRLENCNRTCSLPGEEFQECGSSCPDTCARARRPPGSCPYRCKRGCFCKKGLYRTKSGHCVPLQDCDGITTTPITDALPVTVPDDCHGCPSRAECETYCKSLGNFRGLCTGEGRRHCRCV